MAIATLRFSISHLACPDVRVSPLRFSQRSMVAVVQLVEHLVVVQDVAGSSPVSHPDRKVPKPLVSGLFSCCGAKVSAMR